MRQAVRQIYRDSLASLDRIVDAVVREAGQLLHIQPIS